MTSKVKADSVAGQIVPLGNLFLLQGQADHLTLLLHLLRVSGSVKWACSIPDTPSAC